MLMLGSWGWLWGRLVSDGERTKRGQITQPVVVWQGVYAPSHENGPREGGRRGVECGWVRGGQAEKEEPQPQLEVALGFLKTKPRDMISSLKSTVVPLR